MAADDLLSILPVPALDDTELGVSPLPAPPQPPQMPQEGNKHRTANSIMLALAALLGPQRGGGIPQGVMRGNQAREQTRRQEFQLQQQNFQREDQQYAIQQRQYEQQRDQRSRTFQSAVENLRKQVGTMTDKAEYDAQMEAYANTLSAAGYRHIDANRLRIMVPFIAPSAKQRAQETLKRWRANPHNMQLLKDDPRRALGSELPFDRDDDGIPERITLHDLTVLGEEPVAQGPDGNPIFSEPGTTQEMKANADGILQQLVAKAKAEGKAITPELMITLQEEAITRVDKAKPPNPTDPLLTEMRELRLQQERDKANQPKATYPPDVQRRIDAATKGFDSQAVVKRTQTMAEAVSFANSLDPNTKNPADDQALIYAFAKAMDPESVVREGEYATVQKYAQQWSATFGFNMARIFSNTPFLTPQARANMKKTIQSRYAAARGQYDNVRSSYVQRINKLTGKADGEDWLIDYGAAFPTNESTPDTADPAASGRDKLNKR